MIRLPASADGQEQSQSSLNQRGSPRCLRLRSPILACGPSGSTRRHAELEALAAGAERHSGVLDALSVDHGSALQRASQKKRKQKEEDAEEKRETKWVCTACGADHHNPRKQACRVCGEARQSKQSPKTKGQPALKLGAPDATSAGIAGRLEESEEDERPLQALRQLAAHLPKNGHKLHSVAVPEPTPDAEERVPNKRGPHKGAAPSCPRRLVNVGVP